MINKNRYLKLNPVFKNGRFLNPKEKKIKSSLHEIFALFRSVCHEIGIFFKSLFNGKKREPNKNQIWMEQKAEIVPFSTVPTVTWIGHATFLIQIGKINILTDLIFGNITFLFRRIFPAIPIESLPKIDYVLISHNHLDHMDSFSLRSLKKINPEIKVLVPQGDKKWFDNRGFSHAFELSWWDEHEYISNENKIKFTFLPSYHWSQRSLFDQNKSLWGSWMIEYDQFSIYFAGDTAYSDHFTHIAKEFSNIDIALMPIGPCEPREKMCHSHISAKEAIRSFIDLKAQHFIPMHWGTFYFGTDLFDTPITQLKTWWHEHKIELQYKTLNILKFGQKIEFAYPSVTLTERQSVQTSE